jgi:hypothetical protein
MELVESIVVCNTLKKGGSISYLGSTEISANGKIQEMNYRHNFVQS